MIRTSREALDALYEPFMRAYRDSGITAEFVFTSKYTKHDNGHSFDELFLEIFKLYDNNEDHLICLWNPGAGEDLNIENTVAFALRGLRNMIDRPGRMAPTRAEMLARFESGNLTHWTKDPDPRFVKSEGISH